MSPALPVIDLQSFGNAEDLAAELMRVGKDPGFFYVVGHELGDHVAADVFALAQAFFNAPLEDKLAFANGSGDLGYTGLREETLSGAGPGDIKESFYLSDPGMTAQPLPAELERGRETMAAFFSACDTLAKTLLEGFAIGLGMSGDFLSRAHTGESCRMRLINYPPVSQLVTPHSPTSKESEDIRAGAHSDYGSLTLLFRQPSDQGGLQVLRDGAWIDVPCLPDAIVVNIGDALEFWTAGRLRSTMHRVAFPRTARENVGRLSIPVFIQPDRHVILAPIESRDEPLKTGQGLSAEFKDVLRRKGYENAKPVTSSEHLNRRIRATCAKV
ncbi:2OG-Fe(II) oxygenase superfamily protein [Colletotrichum sublineola]|uniref:Putative 2OG-Fe(II)oxygenase superfamily protein n=1 Tax=Colletotrichum sublineola TaxID=1173701 RepID=A0A066X4D0_COLSU|nr:2OG-Fe(II) oxygenase superfamily protein [Colletotrichum sublineola]KDN64003.1 putative 2OG-Fe(II)oxygenase superfamily protein [Colletotrichum sublineola]